MPSVESTPPIDWAIWRITTNAELWKAVSLSCGIYPGDVQYVGPRDARILENWMRAGGDKTGYQPPQDEFHDRVHTAARHVGEFRALRPVGSIPTDDLGYCTVRVADVAALALKLGWDVPPEFAALAAPELSDNDSKNRPIAPAESVSAQQGKQILSVITKLGHNPAALPKPPAGKAGIKKQVRDRLPRLTDNQFDRRWKELRKEGVIADVSPMKRKR